MNKKQAALSARVARVSKRLDFKIADPDLGPEENDHAHARLVEIARAIEAMLPAPHLSIEERLERPAAMIPGVTPGAIDSDAVKLARIVARVDELVPGSDLSTIEKIERLGELFHDAKKKPGVTARA